MHIEKFTTEYLDSLRGGLIAQLLSEKLARDIASCASLGQLTGSMSICLRSCKMAQCGNPCSSSDNCRDGDLQLVSLYACWAFSINRNATAKS